jgi:hypothetical protein
MRMAISLGFALLATRCRMEPRTPLAASAASDDAESVRRLLAAGHPPRDGGGHDRWPMTRLHGCDDLLKILDRRRMQDG